MITKTPSDVIDRLGTTAVITGGARGFGRAFGAALLAEGANVVLVDRDSAVEQTATALAASNAAGGTVIGVAADITDEARIAEMGVAKLRRLFEVNVMGTIICTLAARPYMAGRQGASIINIASAAAFQGGAYGNSKLAVIGLTMTFARELAAAANCPLTPSRRSGGWQRLSRHLIM